MRVKNWYEFATQLDGIVFTSAHHSIANDMAKYGVVVLGDEKVNQSTKLMQ